MTIYNIKKEKQMTVQNATAVAKAFSLVLKAVI